jgi:hypothetical protein
MRISSSLVSSTIIKGKESDESVTASTTLQDDDLLSFSVESGQTWIIDAFLKVEFNTLGQIKVALNGPSVEFASVSATLIPEAIVPSYGTVSALATGIPLVSVGATGGMVKISAALSASASGTVSIQWAQNTSNGAATTVKAGSYMIANRI